MKNSLLSNIKYQKYLGVILDSKMSCNPHIAYVKNKVAKGSGIMCKARNYLDMKSYEPIQFLYIYHCVVLSSSYGAITFEDHLYSYLLNYAS